MEIMKVKFVVPIEPLPQTRPRFSRFGGVYFPKSFQEYKVTISKAAVLAMQGLEPMTGELKAVLKFYRKYKRISCRYGDCDNLSKAVLDACNGIVYADDSQIVSVTCTKYTDKDKPRIEIEIQRAEKSAELTIDKANDIISE